MNLKLKMFMFENKITLERLQETSGINLSYISLHINGKRNFDKNEMKQIADGLSEIVNRPVKVSEVF